MEVKEINSQSELEAFLAAARPATFLNSWNWGAFEIAMGHKLWRLGAYESGTLVAVVTMTKITARRGTFLAWHHGPVIHPKQFARTQEIVQLFRDHSVQAAAGENCHFIRVSSIIADTPEHEGIFKELGFRNAPIHLHSEHTSVIDVTRSEEEMMKCMRKNTRYAIRKAEKDGVEIIQSADMGDFEKFWAIYMDTVKRQHFTPFSRKYLENEFRTFLQNGQALIWFGK